MKIGNVDSVSGTTVKGWAFDTDALTAPILECVIGGEPILTFRPALFRPDLLSISPNGKCAFAIDVPILKPRTNAQIRFAETKVPVPNGALLELNLDKPSLTLAELVIPFVSEDDFLSCLSPVLSVSGPRQYVITLEIYGADDLIAPCRRIEIHAEDIYDGRRHDFMFKPIPAAKGKGYIAKFFVQGSTVEHRVQIDQRPECQAPELSALKEQKGDLAKYDIVFRYSPSSSPSHYPLGVCLSPVSQCNLNCTHCISRFTRRTVAKAGPRVLQELIEGRKEGSLTCVAFDYSGDIFFYEAKYGGILDFLNEHAISITSVDTHANNITEAVTLKLLHGGLRRIHFSMDAGCASTYEKIRRGGSWEKVLEGIRTFESAYQKWTAVSGANAQPVVRGFSMVALRSNIHECLLLIHLAKAFGIDEIFVNVGEIYTDDMESESLYGDPEYANFWFDRIAACAVEHRITVNLPPKFEARTPAQGHQFCSYPWESPIILGNGDVLACCIPTMKMGNLNEKSLSEIWNGNTYRVLRETVNTDEEAPQCRDCPRVRKLNNELSYFSNRVLRDVENFDLWAERRAQTNAHRD